MKCNFRNFRKYYFLGRRQGKRRWGQRERQWWWCEFSYFFFSVIYLWWCFAGPLERGQIYLTPFDMQVARYDTISIRQGDMSSMGGGLLAGQGGRPCVGICYLRSLQTLKRGKMFSGRRWTCLHWTWSGTNPVWASAICRESGGWVLNKNVWVFNILICILKSRERQRSRYSRSRRREVRRRPVLDFAISPRFPDVDI